MTEPENKEADRSMKTGNRKKILAGLLALVLVLGTAAAGAETAQAQALELGGLTLDLPEGATYDIYEKKIYELYATVRPFAGRGETDSLINISWMAPFEAGEEWIRQYSAGVEDQVRGMMGDYGMELTAFEQSEVGFSEVDGAACAVINYRAEMTFLGVSMEVHERVLMFSSEGFIIVLAAASPEQLDDLGVYVRDNLHFTAAEAGTGDSAMQAVEIPEIGISVSLPEDAIIFRRGDAEADPRLTAFGYTRELLLNQMGTNTYVYAFSPKFRWDLGIISEPVAQDVSLETMTDDQLEIIRASMVQIYEGQGSPVEGSDVVRLEGKAFLRIWGPTPDGSAYKLQYITLIHKRNYIFTLTRYNSPVTEEDRQMMDRIVSGSEL